MSLVAYGYSSSEESETEDEITETPDTANISSNLESRHDIKNVQPADIDPATANNNVFTLPAPKKMANDLNVEEEDDEFLRKKAVPEVKPSPKLIPTLKTKNGKVQITVPSLKDFKEVDTKRDSKPIIGADMPKKSTGLLGILPKPKSESAFTPSLAAVNPLSSSSKPVINRLIPDSVANRPRNLKQEANQLQKLKLKKTATAQKLVEQDISDESGDDDKADFFSLNKDEKLPEVSVNEINVMVAKRAARMAELAKQFVSNSQEEPQPSTSGSETVACSTVAQEEDLANHRALSSLIGGNKAKRTRLEEVNVIDISSSDIVPSKEDFLRRKLQDETGFVPTGHLTGDWTCTSKRKSHITYLASKAQDNAQELEAMWASNRQSRRQTQSKYGF